MTTFNDVIQRTRRRLMTSMREPVNVLSTGIDADDTTLAFSYETRFTDGARLSVELEEMQVVAGASTTSCNVIRGMNGTTGASHSAGVIVRPSPTWTDFEIAQAVNDELADLSSIGLFRIRSVEFDYNPAVIGYELTGLQDFLSVWRVRYDSPGPDQDWTLIPPSRWRVDNAANTVEFPSGVQIVLVEGGHPGFPVRVSYRATFDTFTLTDSSALSLDVLATTGLHVEAHDILSLGAAIRLLSGLEAQRAYSTAQADPRRSDEIPPRTAVGAITPLLAQRQERVRNEAARLATLYPMAYT